jgi:CheY-like chemotaxis protein
MIFHSMEPSMPNHKKVLIIDDERDMQIYLRTLFRKEGYDTAVAENGEQGLALAESFEPDLITLDLLMPKKSGVTAYESLRQAPGTRDIPVIIISGLSKREEMFLGDAQELPPPDAVMDKPIDREVFIETVRRILEGDE